MTGSARRSKRRRWLAGIGLLLVSSVALVRLNNRRLQIETEAWLREAEKGNPLILLIRTECALCTLPGLRDYDKLWELFGRPEVTVSVFDAEDADKLLAMPPCPVKLAVETTASTPPEVVQRLRERFGDALQ